MICDFNICDFKIDANALNYVTKSPNNSSYESKVLFTDLSFQLGYNLLRV